MERLPNVLGSSHVHVAVEQQCRDVNVREHVAKVRFGEGSYGDPHGGGMELREHRRELVNHVRRRPVREERSDHGWHPPMGRQLGVSQVQPETLLDDFGRKGTGPARIGRHEDQRARNGGMPAVELEGEAAAPREAGDVRSSQTERRDERGETVGPVDQAERLRWVR